MVEPKLGIARPFSLTEVEGRKSLSVKFDDISMLETPRSEWVSKLTQDSLLWIAGGGTYLINDRYMLLVKRSADAPSNPGKLTILTGLSDNLEEWREPGHLIRELFEEVVLIDQKRACFYWPSSHLESESVIKQALADTAYADFSGYPLNSSLLVAVERDEVVVHDGEKTYISNGLVHLKANQINLLHCIQFDAPIDFETLTYLDTEFIYEDGKKKFLNRDIFFYDLHKQCIVDLSYRATDSEILTDHAKSLVEELLKLRS